MGFYEDAAADALSILDEVGKVVALKNGTNPAIDVKVMVTQPMVLQDLETGGFLNQTTFEVKFPRDFAQANPTLVAYGNTLSYAGQEFRIVAIADRPPSAWIIAKVQTKVQ
jgi:hypothetical protein